jgi:hypothetical protein
MNGSRLTTFHSSLTVLLLIGGREAAGADPPADRAKIVQQLRLVGDSVDAGKAQIRLNDFDGAIATLARLKDHPARDFQEFASQLIGALAASGDANGALSIAASIHWSRAKGTANRSSVCENSAIEREYCNYLLAMARGLAQAGRKVEAQWQIAAATQIVEKKLENEDGDKAKALFEVAETQIAIGAIEHAKVLARRLAESVDALGGQNADDRAHYRFKLALLSAKLADDVPAKRYFKEALESVTVEPRGNRAGMGRVFSITQAKLGKIDAALETAGAISFFGSDSNEALLEIALLQLGRGDREAAEKTARMIRSYPQYRDDAFAAISENDARSGETTKAIKIANDIEETTRRAIAMLTIAAITAGRGDKDLARKIAEGLTYPTLKKRWPVLDSDQKFVFRDPKSWDVVYESWGSIAGQIWCQKKAHDLTASAMRCWVAIDGKGFVPEPGLLEKWDLRKVARAQATGGDSAGVLGWMKDLSGAKLRDARLGVAEGYIIREEEKARAGKKAD